MSIILSIFNLVTAVLTIPQNGTLAYDLLRRIIMLPGYVRPDRQGGRCERLPWSDLPDGPVHFCNGSSPLGTFFPLDYPPYMAFDFPDSRWEDLVSALFNMAKAWDDPGREITEVKHREIPLATSAIKVDLRIILAFALCTVMGVIDHESYQLQRIYGFQQIDGAMICHLKGKPHRCCDGIR